MYGSGRGGNSRGGGRGRGRHGGGGRGRGRHGGGGGRGRGRFGGGGGGRGRGGSYGRGRHGGRGGPRSPHRSSDSGNRRERIAVESGNLVLIDQFMLANPQFYERVVALIDAEPDAKDQVVKDYGGCVVNLEPGTYRIQRDPFAYTIVIHPNGDRPTTDNLTADAQETGGRVFIDTRCLAMIDRELLDDTSLLEKYQQLWFSGNEKACRDLLRDNGGAVRYGFQRFGDELGVHSIAEENVVCLWPDVTGEAENIDTDSVEEVA
ncbi:MAG: hypothetical protein KDD56_00160 [Bdellovibrionales bacterium]|nr:hypothetical protein [Bdellovibrionales bacterium]